MTTKLLICISDFRQGGIPRCLQSLLTHIDTERVAVDVVCLSHEGPYSEQMPRCHVIAEDWQVAKWMVFTKKITVGNLIQNLPALCLKVYRKLIWRMLHRDVLTERLQRIGQGLRGYDVAIAYAEGYPAQVVEAMPCQRKLLWIHNDYDFGGARGGAVLTNYAAFNRIVCVSRATEESFRQYLPQYAAQTCTLHNITNEEFIRKQAVQPLADSAFHTDRFTILSIGRICTQKQFTAIPPIAKALKERGAPFRWYILGDGPEMEVKTLRQAISACGVEQEVILLGRRDNPYQYLRQADLFALTSLYESYPTVINEARCLGIPIIANAIPPSYEMLEENEGIIVPNNQMAEVISILMNDENVNGVSLNSMKRQSFHNNNEKIMEAFYKLLNE